MSKERKVLECFVSCLRVGLVWPAVLTVFPGVDIDVAGALTSADILGSRLVLQWSPEECPAAEAGGGPVVNMSCRPLSADLQEYSSQKRSRQRLRLDKVWIIMYLAGWGLSKKDKTESVTCNKFIRLSRALEVALTVPCRSLWRTTGEPGRGVWGLRGLSKCRPSPATLDWRTSCWLAHYILVSLSPLREDWSLPRQ